MCKRNISILIFLTLISFFTWAETDMKSRYMAVEDSVINGEIIVTPEIVEGKSYPAETIFNIKAIPDPGYTIDSVYYAVNGQWWVNYTEVCNSSEMNVTLTKDIKLGASFIKEDELKGFSVLHDVVYAAPGAKQLKYDLYKPDNAKNLPLIVIVHGGGWTSNNEDVMRGMAREIVKTGKYVVASIDYRWVGTLDGDSKGNSVNQLIEDVYGAIAHIIENSDKYGVDSNRIALTGDSAGGHLSASAATMVERIGSNGFNTKTNKYEYNPTYLPKNMNVKQFREKLIASIKAVAPSYGVFATTALKMSPAGSEEISTNNNALNAISPITNIPESSSRKIPHFMVRGTKDPLISNQEVQSYVDALQEKGQEVVYIQIEGASHAFYDWKPDDITKKTFNQTGKTNIDEMLEFFNKYLNIQ